MADALSIDKSSTAVLIMDFQTEIVDMIPESRRVAVVDNAAAIVAKARQAGIPVIYVAVRFREGYPEVSERNKLFCGIKTANRLREGTPQAEIHARLKPAAGEAVVTKRRVSAFATTDLDALLKARNVTHLILCGLVTSGVVLSTVRGAGDLDYGLTVVEDACADGDEEVHRVLTTKIFVRQCNVVSTQALLAAI